MKTDKRIRSGQLMIAAAGMCWGTIGTFAQILMDQGLSASMVSLLRMITGCLLLGGFTAITNPEQLRIDRRGLFLTAMIGLISQGGFNLLYFNAIQHIGIAMSAVLLYTAPFFLLLWSVLFFGERLTLRKISAILLCSLGCAVAVTGGNLSNLQISGIGLLLGLLSAVSFSLMSAISKHALKDYQPITVVIYSFFFGALFLIPFNISSIHPGISINAVTIAAVLALGLIPSALSYRLYAQGISHGVDLSAAGVLSTLEMVFSVLLAWAVFHEPMGPVRWVGVLIILFSIWIMNCKMPQFAGKKVLPRV